MDGEIEHANGAFFAVISVPVKKQRDNEYARENTRAFHVESALVYAAEVFMPRRRNEQDWVPPIPIPRGETGQLGISLLWEYASAAQEDRFADQRQVYEEHAPLSDPEAWGAAEEWLDREKLVEIHEMDEEGLAQADVTPLGYAVLRWWGWEDVTRVGNPEQIRAGDFVVVREPATRRYYVVSCGNEQDGKCVMLTLLGPEGGASSPSSAAMWARRIGGPHARVWLIEREHAAFPISRTANALATKQRLRAMV